MAAAEQKKARAAAATATRAAFQAITKHYKYIMKERNKNIMAKKSNVVKAARRLTKKEIYSLYGIEYKDGYILAPLFGWIKPLLVNGNSKIGRGVWHFSTMAGTGEISAETEDGGRIFARATCPCDCVGCYGKTGCFRYKSVKESLARKTVLATYHMEWTRRAILAQIIADNVETCRIHATGDFAIKHGECSQAAAYIEMWRGISLETPNVQYWAYTKLSEAETAFNNIPNVNIVRSIVPGCGYNFGHCDKILKTYRKLMADGEKVYICRCGVDKEQHCNNCKGCIHNKYVLFIEHSTDYRAKQDSLFPVLRDLINGQKTPE